MASACMRGVWSWLVGGAALLGAPDVVAAPLVVAWQAPECAQEAAFRARIRDALQREPEVALERELTADVTIREMPANRGYWLQIRMAGGARELELPSCDEALAAAATFVALAIDPQTVVPAEPAPAEPPRAASRPVESSAVAVPPVVLPPAVPERAVAVFGGVSLGEVPAASPLVGARLSWRVNALAVAAEGFWTAAQTERLPGSGKGGSIGLWGGGVAACYVVSREPFQARGCLGAQLGAWRSRGVGVEFAVEQSDWWAAGVARLGARLRVAPSFGLILNADMVVPARRPWFGLQGVDHVFQPKIVAFRPTAGAELTF